MAICLISKEMIIGDVLEQYPETIEIIDNYFGGGCRNCPASFTETLATGAEMHACDIEAVISELNSLIINTRQRDPELSRQV